MQYHKHEILNKKSFQANGENSAIKDILRCKRNFKCQGYHTDKAVFTDRTNPKFSITFKHRNAV